MKKARLHDENSRSMQICILHKVKNKYTIYIQCRKIYNLFVGALETGINVSLWGTFLDCFTTSAN
jgi:hypothetical protein